MILHLVKALSSATTTEGLRVVGAIGLSTDSKPPVPKECLLVAKIA